MSKNNEKLVDEWLKISLQLHNSLKTLKELEELLNEYSKLYSDTTNKVIELSEAYEKDAKFNPAMYLAISSSIFVIFIVISFK